MKTIQLLPVIFTFLFSTTLLANLPDKEKAKEPEKEYTYPSASVCAFLSGEIGIREKGCTGAGLSCTSVEFDVSLSNTQPDQKGKTKICLIFSARQLLNIIFDGLVIDLSGGFVLERDIVLDNRLSTSLGYRQVKLLKGNYKINKNIDGTYSTNVKTSAK